MATVVVIGGGPAGMMAAIASSQLHKTILIEKNEKLGKKLFITGKGRCNITNAKDISEFFDYIPGNPTFLYSSLYSFTNEDTMNFFKNLDVNLKVERGDRVFPQSDKSSDIIKAFERELIKRKVDIQVNSKVKKLVCENNTIKAVQLQDDKIIKGDYFIICTGGMSYPQTGSSGDGYRFAESVGHNITKITPSLVPIEVKNSWIKDLQGLSLKNVELSIINSNNKILFKEFGEMLFTHFGISGPIALSASRVVNENSGQKAVINLKPALSYEELDKRVQKDFAKYSNKDFRNTLDDLLPKKLIEVLVQFSKIDPNKKANLITRDERKQLVKLLQNFTLDIKGLRPIAEAIVTAGGVDTKEIDSSTMKSKLVSNLYFAGEVIDVDAYTGGYNIQIAMSTGHLAGSKISEIE
ncbi:NAD(P)/FAD-dependent oxidoreductase [Clostridium sp. DJ247]|uniref:NAD(P)/FAD-dependent oxidoreductase n=1 Tax=Clostridium sp. DJ247 TaxID=2726188 RepID=UPI00162444A6|nr:NAD(P)/FAD-dependent oxidoreductase [Clostridium sp. DJ247]MBC2581360.1 NAD(P)/FAD-dependent oxidoreductase [Clostridium sp. DJ247]